VLLLITFLLHTIICHLQVQTACVCPLCAIYMYSSIDSYQGTVVDHPCVLCMYIYSSLCIIDMPMLHIYTLIHTHTQTQTHKHTHYNISLGRCIVYCCLASDLASYTKFGHVNEERVQIYICIESYIIHIFYTAYMSVCILDWGSYHDSAGKYCLVVPSQGCICICKSPVMALQGTRASGCIELKVRWMGGRWSAS
jgi:hypothetical protein